eukprot:13559322-Ditylum_brightwellii.AAC.1
MIASTFTTPSDLNVDVTGTTIITTTITTTLKTNKEGTTEDSTVGLMDDATTQVRTARQRYRAIKMRPHFKTRWEEVQEDANDG